MKTANDPARHALDEGLIALVQLLARLAAREHLKTQLKFSEDKESDEKSCK